MRISMKAYCMNDTELESLNAAYIAAEAEANVVWEARRALADKWYVLDAKVRELKDALRYEEERRQWEAKFLIERIDAEIANKEACL